MIRKILHIDMDAFFASVEQRDDPELRGKPVAVGGSGERGVVAAASYEARCFGVHSAMPGKVARRKCPELIFVRPDFEKYKTASRRVFTIFHQVTDLVEGLSLDEAFLDVTENHWNEPSATRIAERIRNMIREEVQLTASAGVAASKSVAKMASGYNKPDGMTIVPPERTLEFLRPLPIRKIPGVGPVTGRKLIELSINTIGELERFDRNVLVERLGKQGDWIWQLANGRDNRPVQIQRKRKSQSAERTFSKDILDVQELEAILLQLTERVCLSLNRSSLIGRTVFIKVRYSDFTTCTRSLTISEASNRLFVVFPLAKELMKSTEVGRQPVRLLGFGLSNLRSLLDEIPGRPKQLKLPFY